MPGEYQERNRSQWIGLFVGPILFFGVLCMPVDPQMVPIRNMSALALFMGVYWFTEAIPLAMTALLPFALYPILGIMSAAEAAQQYFNTIVFLFIGGFLIALAMEQWGLHKRIALIIIRSIGGHPDRIILGFILCSGFLSMWITNTATTLLLLPIGLSMVYKLEEKFGKEAIKPFTIALMLAIAYAASVGGMATLIGSTPNLAFLSIYEKNYPNAPAFAFADWILMALPIAVVMLAFIWLILVKLLFPTGKGISLTREEIDQDYLKLGKCSPEEWWVLAIFSITALLWVTRRDLEFGFATLKGWAEAFPVIALINDATVAVLMASILFIVPTRSKPARRISATLLDSNCFSKLPWGVIILFGGGFALAEGFSVTGLADYLGDHLAILSKLPNIAIIIVICIAMTLLTEITSNTATTLVMLPILVGLSSSINVNPILLMLPTTFAASYAFMMPVATPPNAVIFGSGRLKISHFIRAGILMNVVGILTITLAVYFLAGPMLGADIHTRPSWAQ
ncbi:SLC13 family permease [Flexibacterium corallicola]|uniref:SLC13 family permease n=1 Tax=Flexibacterium corallicola TaxID=3037259 RepID=UPI00286EC888|nr:SLC13 family permease [Pseudovibrio sp. M1P-2-3]